MPFVSRRSLLAFALLLAAVAALAVGFLWSGLYDVGADDPHLPPVHGCCACDEPEFGVGRCQRATAPSSGVGDEAMTTT